MLKISMGRFIGTFIIGFLITSNINWGIAEFFLNDWARGPFEGFFREGEDAASALAIIRMTVGFMLPLFVVALLQAMLDKPSTWPRRAMFTSTLVSLGAFYGTYTFISGWGNVNWFPLMVTATCDWVSLVIGAFIIGWLQEKGRA